MRRTGWIAIASGALVVAGCAHGYHTASLQARYSTASRPDPSYFCYDCHGYRFFDPYYDYCVGQGFRYRWADHPRAMIVYRDRYVRIKEAHPDYGRYRYRSGYRSNERYRDPRDYEAWRAEAKQGAPPGARPGREPGSREKDVQEQGKKNERKGEKRKGPRDNGSRLTLPGGVS